MSKISGDFSPCKHFTVKKVSLDSVGSVVFDADVNDVVRNTTFTLRYVCCVFVDVQEFEALERKRFGEGRVGREGVW